MACNKDDVSAPAAQDPRMPVLLREIKRWIQSEPLIPDNISDQSIKWFVKGSEYNLEDTKLMIKAHYQLKAQRPSVFKNRDPECKEVKNVWETVYIVCFPQNLHENKVFYVGLKNYEPKNFDMVTVERLFHMIVDASVYLEIASDAYILIIDGRGVSMRHFKISALPQMKAALKYLQTGIPLTMKEIHVINTTIIIRKLFFLTKPFMEKRLTDKIRFHATANGLLEMVPVSVLPIELGGENCSLDQMQEVTRMTVESLKEWFEMEEESRDKALERSSLVRQREEAGVFPEAAVEEESTGYLDAVEDSGPELTAPAAEEERRPPRTEESSSTPISESLDESKESNLSEHNESDEKDPKTEK